MFDVEVLATIDADLAGAQQGDRDAQLRLMNFHVPWLLVFARTVNTRIIEGFYAEKADPVVGEPEEQPTSKVENENIEDASKDTEEGSENVEGGSEDALETTETEKVEALEADQDDSVGEDSVAVPGSSTALAEDAAIAEANENKGDPISSSEPHLESDPLDELVLKPHQVLVPHDYVMESELYEAAGGVFFEPGFTPEGGYTAPWLINEADEVASETENNGEGE